MITKETLEIINTALDAEMEKRVDELKVIDNDSAAEMKKRVEEENVQRIGKQSNPLIQNSTRINQEHKQHGQPYECYLPKVDPEETEHIKLHQKIINYFDFLGIFFGTKFRFDWKPHKHFLVWYTSLLLIFVWFSILRGQYIHYRSGDYVRILELCAIYGMALSCVQKWIGTLRHYKTLAALIYSAHDLCRKNVVGNRAEVIKLGLRRTLTVLKAYGIGVIICIFSYVALPIKLFLVDDVWMSLLPMEIIFCEQSTLSGFLAANAVQAHMGIYYGLATMMYPSVFLVSICYYRFQVELVGEDFKDLDKMWNGTSTTSVGYRHAYLRNICHKLQDMHTFLDTVKTTYTLKLLIYFVTNYISQIVCLFEIMKNSWLPGFPMAIILFIEMMFYCIIGTQICIGDDHLCAIIYGSNWYSYDLKSQRIIMVLLHDSQKSKEIYLQIIGPLNVVTFISIVKSMYTYFTVLSEIL